MRSSLVYIRLQIYHVSWFNRHGPLPESAIRHYRPSFVILEYGTNDIVNGADPLHIATTIIDIANRLINTYSVAYVSICSILNRTACLHQLSPEQFKAKAYKVNHHLRTMCAGDKQLTFHVHKGFWSTPTH